MFNELKNVVCHSCDGFCPVAAKVDDGRVVKVTTREHPFFKDVICMKGAFAPKSFARPERLMYPLKRTGARGEGGFERVSWNQAMDEIAERLQKSPPNGVPRRWPSPPPTPTSASTTG